MTLDLTRQEGALDTALMRGARVLGVGTGGASGLYEDLARCGLGSLTVIDFDTVDNTNLTTQGYDAAQLGMYKVDALGERLKAVSPAIQYRALNRNFLDIQEDEMTALVMDQDLILMMTDNFYAQARGNLVALKHLKPAVFAITYALARCSEVTFMIPGVTPACHRCAVSSRYASYEKGFVNEVQQQASTILQTHYLSSADLPCFVADRYASAARW